MSSEPSTPKRAQIQAAVLTATEELLAEGVSFSDLNIEKIATRAGISRTAFYFYFKDKRELLMRLTEDVSDALFGAADIWFSGEGAVAMEEMHRALEGIAALYEEHDTLLRAIVEVSTYDDEIAQFWRGLLQRFVDASSRRIETEQAAGRAPAFPPAPTAFALTWMVERTFYQQLVQGLDANDLVDAMHGIWTRSIYGVVSDEA
jgi:AcrR family transcriptional regulator